MCEEGGGKEVVGREGVCQWREDYVASEEDFVGLRTNSHTTSTKHEHKTAEESFTILISTLRQLNLIFQGLVLCT